MELRDTSTIGVIIEHLKRTKRPRLPESVEQKERKLEEIRPDPNSEESPSIQRLRKLKEVLYQEVIALSQFIDGHTPFSTKHGVKGDEFENVLVVVGRGWNLYNFNQFLELAEAPERIPSDKKDFFERNRNLFYVICSRPKKRLAVLFTQQLTGKAITTLTNWFGSEAIHALQLHSHNESNDTEHQ